MANTTNNIEITDDSWTDVNTASGIAVGTKIIVENLGDDRILVVVNNTEPLAIPVAYQVISPYRQKVNEAGDQRVWAKSEFGNTKINVKIFT